MEIQSGSNRLRFKEFLFLQLKRCVERDLRWERSSKYTHGTDWTFPEYCRSTLMLWVFKSCSF